MPVIKLPLSHSQIPQIKCLFLGYCTECLQSRVSTKQIKKNSVPTENNRNRICFMFVLVHFRNQWKFRFGLFRFVSVFQMYFETTETNSSVSKWTKSNQICILKQPKRTDLFQNEPKQTKNVPIIETNRFVSKWTKQTENDLKNIKSKKNFREIKKFVQISIF